MKTIRPMIKSSLLVAALLLFGSQSLFAQTALEASTGAPPEIRIKMTAQKYKFEPEIVRVPINTRVFITIESLDKVHGFKLIRYGIDKEIPAKGEGTVTVEFYARERGTYKFKCSQRCGIKHPWMNGKLVVE